MLEKLPDAVGHALRDQRAGLAQCTYTLIDLRAGTAALQVTSLAFADHAPLPNVARPTAPASRRRWPGRVSPPGPPASR